MGPASMPGRVGHDVSAFGIPPRIRGDRGVRAGGARLPNVARRAITLQRALITSVLLAIVAAVNVRRRRRQPPTPRPPSS